MLRYIPFISALLVFINSSTAQKVELGTTAGVANYTGDLAPYLVFKETRPTIGLFARYNFNHTWAFNAQLNQLRIGGDDANFEYNNARNIRFRTDITEIAGVFEFNYFKYGPGVLDKRFTPYVFWGLGMALYNPQGFYRDKWYDLRQYQTEGAENAYSGVTVVMPMGIGLKWMPNKRMSVECSFGARKTYTDYLDDVSNKYPDLNKQLSEKGVIAAALSDPSVERNEGAFQNKQGYQRGNPDIKDWYFTTNVSLTFRIFTRIKCARFY